MLAGGECEMNLTHQRQKRTQHMIPRVGKIAPGDRRFDQHACLLSIGALGRSA